MSINNIPVTKSAFTIGKSLIGEGIINYKTTNNMNTTNDNASQTLFRFVSLRNPQLTETKEANLGFIHRPKGVKGVFDAAAATTFSRSSKIGSMAKIASGFIPEGFETEQKIETGTFLKFLIMGRKISKKEALSSEEETFIQDYYKSLTNGNKELTVEGIAIFTSLWDNYIYQIITQKDFYVKEAISHILMALHLGFAKNLNLESKEIISINGERPLEKIGDSKIVLPKHLFSDDSAGSRQVASRMTDKDSVLGDKTIQRLESEANALSVVNKSLYRKEVLEKLAIELEKLQKKYHKSYEQAYKESYNRYLDSNKESLELYEIKLAEIDSKITEKTTEEEKIRLYETLKKYEVKPFEFSYENEINAGELKNKLSPESFDTFIDLFAEFDAKRAFENSLDEEIKVLSDSTLKIGDQIIALDDEIQTYSDAVSVIKENVSSSMRTALENSPLSKQQYVNIGGASVPVIQNTARTPMAYSFYLHSPMGITGSRGFVAFAFEVEDVSWSVANAKIIATSDTEVDIEENYSNIQVIDNKITLPISLVNKFRGGIIFRIEIIFDNGSSAHTDLGKLYIKDDIRITGMLTLSKREAGAEISTEKRKNFGIKRLGVADYMKVVQSVHAYVPGEVSNIENVMASELRHKSSVARDYSEITDTTSKSQETEKMSDTSKTSRTDMQTEVAKEIRKEQSISAHTRFTYGNSNAMSFEIGADYANNTAQNDSTRQAMMKSQEITERAMERVLTKISEERVQKIIKEYTETNVHEYDNRGKALTTNAAPQHITGVYRWIDMKYKNQIYNYGKRTMFEFMVPEPSRLHRLALTVAKAQVLTAPVDPRTAPEKAWTMPNPKSASVEQIKHWAQVYGVKLTDLLKETITDISTLDDGRGASGWEMRNYEIGVPANYTCTNYGVHYLYKESRKKGKIRINGSGDLTNHEDYLSYGANATNKFYIQANLYYINLLSLKIAKYCRLSDDYMNSWKTESFNTIIKAYEEAYQKFLEEQARLDAEYKEKEAAAKEKQGNYYRYMEHDTLKHNCIAYLLQDYLGSSTLGMETTNALNDRTKMDNFQVYLNDDLDKYTALAKFMEQAFEWEIMDYTFYPYYWANRKSWQEFYLTESMDPLFRSFLQAGMARVIVTVKPGFEAAVQFFLETGLIWNGGAVPVIGDPMYLSIVDEMRQPTGVPQGKYWITKVPTTLTILQDKSTGLPVEKPLPIFPENEPENCENPLELEFTTSFRLDDKAQLQHGEKDTSTLG